jgi:hypothetical protein
MSVEKWQNDDWQGNLKKLKKNLLQGHFVDQDSHVK